MIYRSKFSLELAIKPNFSANAKNNGGLSNKTLKFTWTSFKVFLCFESKLNPKIDSLRLLDLLHRKTDQKNIFRNFWQAN